MKIDGLQILCGEIYKTISNLNPNLMKGIFVL